ncbi:MAG: glycosyl hydrolase, partial [Gammaproteobacteria bacterium]|nr:glycosyl hydrolase [Gammaproteobacteria bacterium]
MTRFLRRLIAVIAITLNTPFALADFGDYASHAVDGETLIVQTSLGELRVTAIDDAAFEVHYVEDGVKQLPSFALAGDPPRITTAVTETETSLAFAIDGLIAVINKSPVRIEYASEGKDLFSEEHGYFAYDTVRGFRFQLDEGEKILGGGQRVLGMDRRGRRMPLYNKASYGYETETDQMYYSVPAVMSSDKYMIVFDNTASGWLDIGSTENGGVNFEAPGTRTDHGVSPSS